MFLTPTIAIAALTLFASTVQQEHAEHYMECATACNTCELQCESCFKHCLTLVADGQKEHAKTAQICVDCAACCRTCATLCARESTLSGPMLECCAKCCAECAAACEKFPDDKHMSGCAKSCRDCAKECQKMLKQLGK